MTMSAHASVASARGGRGASAAISLASAACALLAWYGGLSAFALVIVAAAAGAAAPDAAVLLLAAGSGIASTACVVLLRSPGRIAEILPIAVLCGLHARRAISGASRLPVALRWAVAATLATIGASVAVQLLIGATVLTTHGLIAGVADFARSFVSGPRAFPYLVAAVQFLTCLGLYAAVAARFTTPQKTTRLANMLIAGGSAVASLTLARFFEILLRSGAPVSSAPHLLASVRLSVTNGDPNATGSMFAMLLTLTYMQVRRARGVSRYAYTGAAVLIGAALWMTGSRTALVVLLLAALAAAGWKWRAGWQTWTVVACIGVVTAAALVVFPNSLTNRSDVAGAAGIRAEMARVAFRLWRTDPLLGVGVGQFYERSAAFIEDPYVRAIYARENAHNNFLQILAELGIIGAGACALLLIATFWSSPPPGLRVSLAVFLATCLAGHPLLVPDVAVAFAFLAGAAGAYASTRVDVPVKRAAILVIIAAAIAIPVSYRAERNGAELDHLGYGVSGWIRSTDGRLYRRSDGDATVFVPAAAAEILVEIKPEDGAPLTVRMSLDGRPGDELSVPATGWFRYRIVMPPRGKKAFVALRLVATDPAGRAAAFDLAKITSPQ